MKKSTGTPSSRLQISTQVDISTSEIEIHAVHSQGAGGQNVNKVATGTHLRFDIHASSLPDVYKQKLLTLKDQRITGEGVIIIKAQRYRSQGKNREDALQRLVELIRSVGTPRKKRRATCPSRSSQQKRLASKKQRGQTKALRQRVKQ